MHIHTRGLLFGILCAGQTVPDKERPDCPERKPSAVKRKERTERSDRYVAFIVYDVFRSRLGGLFAAAHFGGYEHKIVYHRLGDGIKDDFALFFACHDLRAA